jgi:hypothetical protein
MTNQTARDKQELRRQPARLARLVFDSSLSSLPLASGDADDRHLLFVDPDFDIHLKIVAFGSQKQIRGQIIFRKLVSSSVRVALFVQGGQLRETTRLDKSGEFRFDPVPTGNVLVQVLTRARHVATSFDA